MKAWNSKRGRREEEGGEEVPITCHGHKTLPSHAAKILRQLLTFVKSNRQPAHRIDCPLESDCSPDQELETDEKGRSDLVLFLSENREVELSGLEIGVATFCS